MFPLVKSLGFTGTRHGMSPFQKDQFRQFLESNKFHIFRHGDCVGADADAHEIVLAHGKLDIHVHPPIKENLRAWCSGWKRIYEEKPYIVRDKEIVKFSSTLVACPHGPEEIRSGTWTTIRFAKKIGKEVIILWPN